MGKVEGDLSFASTPRLWSYISSGQLIGPLPIYSLLLLFCFPLSLVPQNLEWPRGGKKGGKWGQSWEWGWGSNLFSYFSSFLWVALCRQRNRYVELMVPCTTLWGIIPNVTDDTEHFPVRNLPYLKSRCTGKGPCGFGSLDSSCCILSFSFRWRAPIYHHLFREFVILNASLLWTYIQAPKKVSSGQGLCIPFLPGRIFPSPPAPLTACFWGPSEPLTCSMFQKPLSHVIVFPLQKQCRFS